MNNHVKRLDDLKHVDGIFDEYGYVAACMNANAFLCVNKPLLGCCYNRSFIGSDFDAYMQKHLHLGMYPMAPFPANDHALLPDPEVDQLYLDYIVFALYFVVIIGIAFWVSRKPKGHDRNTEDYFLAGRSLPWWIIGASLIASNISTEAYEELYAPYYRKMNDWIHKNTR